MFRQIQLTETIPFVNNPISRSPWWRGFLFVPLALSLACFAFSPAARAVSPPPDGGYPMQNTAEGEEALLSLNVAVGYSNTALGHQALYFDTTGADNTATGDSALFGNTTGNGNTATGLNTLFRNSTGSDNTAIGVDALGECTGSDNTATGALALNGTFGSDTGSNNTADGSHALYSVSSASDNTATGFQALFSDTTGSTNTASGVSALQLNTTGSNNTATGGAALLNNTTGNFNTATGVDTLVSNNIGTDNTATGSTALFLNTAGSSNTATGEFALGINTTGNNNMADGASALSNNTTGSSNIALGVSAGANLTTGSNNIDIGNAGVAGETGKIRIGTKQTQRATFIAGISGATVANGVGVIINPQGQLGTVVSSERFKDAIQPMDKASEAILALQPVTFRYKHELDPAGIPQFGLVAEQVEKVNPDLVARDDQGKPYSVRYEAVNAMLLNEFLKAHGKLEEQAQINQQQKAINAQQCKEIEALNATLREQAAQIQKVSAQVAAGQVSATTRLSVSTRSLVAQQDTTISR